LKVNFHHLVHFSPHNSLKKRLGNFILCLLLLVLLLFCAATRIIIIIIIKIKWKQNFYSPSIPSVKCFACSHTRQQCKGKKTVCLINPRTWESTPQSPYEGICMWVYVCVYTHIHILKWAICIHTHTHKTLLPNEPFV
jgi:hypothetical protein